MGNPVNPTKKEVSEAIQTLNSLIDDQSDELGQLLTPIVSLLERIVTPMIKKTCVNCGDIIPEARLEYIPSTQHCVKCADKHGPKIHHDPNELCAKASQSCQNGFAPKD